MNRPLLILLAGLALAAVASVFFLIRPLPAPPPPLEEIAITVPAAEAYEALIAKAIAGYNTHDAAVLFADFAESAVPPANEATYRKLFEGYYHEALGECIARRLNLRASEILPDRALLVWTAKFSKAPLVTVSANFVSEGGAPKIVQLRFEPAE